MNAYTISTLAPAPAMHHTFENFSGTYAEAVAATQQSYRATGRSTTLRSGGDRAGYWWHRVSAGVAVDRNRNSGIPERATL